MKVMVFLFIALLLDSAFASPVETKAFCQGSRICMVGDECKNGRTVDKFVQAFWIIKEDDGGCATTGVFKVACKCATNWGPYDGIQGPDQKAQCLLPGSIPEAATCDNLPDIKKLPDCDAEFKKAC